MPCMGERHLGALCKIGSPKEINGCCRFHPATYTSLSTNQIWVQIKLQLEQCTSILSNYSKYVNILLNSKYIGYINSNYIIKDVI